MDTGLRRHDDWVVQRSAAKLTLLAALLTSAALAGCAALEPPKPYACLLPGERRMLVAELFFGRDVAGRQVVSDTAWSEFLASVVTPQFPDGLTVFDGYGQWRNPANGTIGRSPDVKIVLIAVPRDPGLTARFSTVIGAYKARFRQQSVGVITRDSCAAF